ncbi:DUF1850 domain-containing protein [Aeropyrum camini]|uniref:DUF1850 domain-containing protein n=1 Tax=Aeropyrum camini SY1 = JCM 12091 TaxID=1198449 RepID=U3TB83_9CREN|nr:DUF1850 domain-containing protein [Aeropyrum camini]BAN90802.1 hypothetical protein ACAM_1333 [Aeropyrum camini SY1 = JCM 12091]
MSLPRLLLALSIISLSLFWLASLDDSQAGYDIVIRCSSTFYSKAWSETVDEVEISFLHSVHKEVETNIMTVGRRGFWLREVRIPETGAGTPYNLEDLGGSGSVYLKDGVLVFSSLNVYRGKSVVYNLGVWGNVDIKLDGRPVDTRGCRLLALKTP